MNEIVRVTSALRQLQNQASNMEILPVVLKCLGATQNVEAASGQEADPSNNKAAIFLK